MLTLPTIAETRQFRRAQAQGAPLLFVPTMGALHEGHASLVRQARAMGRTLAPHATVIASIFVNPAQFGPAEDFNKYPRTLDADRALLEAAGADAVFVPTAQEMYPEIRSFSTGHSLASTSIDPGPLADVLEGAIRPGHFRGVCTVVAKLLNIVEPTHLLLGQKDFQQQAILRRMTIDLNMPVEVVTCPTVREPDGLAMSSRNRYLSPDERSRAVALYEGLTAARDAFASGERRASPLESIVQQRLVARGLEPQYTTIAHAETLQPWRDAPGQEVRLPAVALVAARLGTTRLIDNLVL